MDLASALGIVYGLAAAAIGYLVSALASGLFARAFYRVYARALIGICSLMLLAAVLWWSAQSPLLARLVLTAADYLALGVLSYAVVRFNREFLETIFLGRRLAAWFAFGTLAWAALITLGVLHLSAEGPEKTVLVHADHYAPSVMLLAALLFHTDYHLKRATRAIRKFSALTFLAYAVSFVAVCLSLLPYRHAFGEVEFEAQHLFLQNFSSAQTLCLAIVLYGCLVWYYESIPPLYLLLLAVCGEYYVLIGQWFEPANFGLAMLPLFAGLKALADYFAGWDQKRRSRREVGNAIPAEPGLEAPRFIVPFHVVTGLLGVVLVAVPLWDRLAPGGSGSAFWLVVTFTAYALYGFTAAVLHKRPALVYAGGTTAGLAALFGFEAIAGPTAAMTLGVLSLLWACTGRLVGLKREYRTALADCTLLSALLVLSLVGYRYVAELGEAGPYHLGHVSLADGMALVATACALGLCAAQYQSQLPVYGASLAVALIAPTLSAAVGLLTWGGAVAIGRWSARRRPLLDEKPGEIFGRFPLPLADQWPTLYTRAFSRIALPLSVLGLLISAVNIFGAESLPIVAVGSEQIAVGTGLAGAATSALTLGLLTRVYPFAALYILSLLAGYFSVHAAAQKLWLFQLPDPQSLSAHLVLATLLSLLGCGTATGYSAWCQFRLRRVAESAEELIGQRHALYSTWLHHVTFVVSTVTLLWLVLRMTLPVTPTGPASLGLAAALVLCIFFGLSGAVYRSLLGSYLSLAALVVAGLNVAALAELHFGPTENALLAAFGLVMAATSRRLWLRTEKGAGRAEPWTFPAPWDRSPLPMEATGARLWVGPLAEFALITAVLVLALASYRHLDELGPAGPYEFGWVDPREGAALAMAACTFWICAGLYHSRLPVYGTVLAILAMAPTLSAGVGLLAWSGSVLCRRILTTRSAGTSSPKLLFFDRLALPAADRRPELYARPLSAAALPLALLGLGISTTKIVLQNIPSISLLGVAVAGLVLGLLTTMYRWAWVCVLSILSAFFVLHASAHKLLIIDLAVEPAVCLHLLVSAVLTLFGWTLATGYSAWCEFRLRHVGERVEGPIRARYAFYSGWLHHTTFAVSCVAIGILLVMTLSVPERRATAWLLAAALGFSVFFGLSGAVYRSKLGSYLSLAALALAALNLVAFAELPRGPADGILLGALGLVTVAISCLLWPHAPHTAGQVRRRIFPAPWVRSPLPLEASGAGLWAQPLAEYALLMAGVALAHPCWLYAARSWTDEALILTLPTLVLAMLTVLLSTRIYRVAGLYFFGLVLGYFSIHSAAQTLFLREPLRLPLRLELLLPHVVLASMVSLVGCAIAASYTAWCRWRLRHVSESAEERIRARCEFYAGWLHHVTLIAAILALAGLVTGAVAAHTEGRFTALLPVAGLLLATFFGLSGAVYRSQVGTYLSLTALGLTAGNILTVTWLPWGPGGVADACALALLGLILAGLSTGLRSARLAALSPSPAPVALPWRHAPLPLVAATRRELWAGPLADMALVMTGCAVLLALGRWSAPDAQLVLATFCATAATLLLTARLYRTAVLTYLATTALWGTVYPLLMVIDVGQGAHGPALGLLALVFWTGSFGFQQAFRPSTPAGAERRLSTLDVSAVYVTPLAHSAAVVALAAVAHALAVWARIGWLAAQGSLLISCLPAALAFFLVTRNLQIAQRSAEARLAVYVGCAVLAGASLVGGAVAWGLEGLGPVTAGLSLLLAAVAVILLDRTSGSQDLLSLYGEPIAHTALGLPILAVLLLATPFATVPTMPDSLTAPLERLGLWGGCALLFISLTYAISVRSSKEARWLYASVVLGSLGLLVLLENALSLRDGPFLLALVLLMNLLVCVARLLRHYQDQIARLLGVPASGCERAFYEWPFFATAAVVLAQAVYFAPVVLRHTEPAAPVWPWPVIPLAASVLFAHLLYLARDRAVSHLLIGSTLLAALWLAAASQWVPTPDVTVVLLGLIWQIAAAGLVRPWGNRILEHAGLRTTPHERADLSAVAVSWAAGLLALSLVIMLPSWVYFHPTYPNAAVSLLVVSIGSALGGYSWRVAPLVPAAAVSSLASIWALLIWWAPSAALVLPAGALSTILLAQLYSLLARRLRARQGAAEDAFGAAAGQKLLVVATFFSAVAAAGALLGIRFAEQGLSPATLLLAFTLLLTAACWVHFAWYEQKEVFVYLAGAALIATFLYVRHGILGAPFGRDIVKAFGVVGLSFLLYGLNILAARAIQFRAAVFVRPSYYSALLLPLALLGTIPFPFHDTGPASLVLFAAGSFYLVVARVAGVRWALYPALILYNVALYLWVPRAYEGSGFLELYVIPAALTVLVFAQLHRTDVNRQTLTAIRLAASASIVSVSTYQVFFKDDQPILYFMAVLFLSLLGTAAGVALRVRAFVYVGVAFLVINVLGQLGLQAQRQEGIGRAAILIVTGIAVLGVMVFFNWKRAEILNRYRYFIADPRWE